MAKILIARLLEHVEEVKAYVLTFDGMARERSYANVFLDYTLLNEELKSKWFQIYKDHVEVSHWNDFVQKFAKNHEDILTREEKRTLDRKRTYNYVTGGDDFKSILEIIAGILNKMPTKHIVMVDEVIIDKACKLNQWDFEVDFSYLRKYLSRIRISDTLDLHGIEKLLIAPRSVKVWR